MLTEHLITLLFNKVKLSKHSMNDKYDLQEHLVVKFTIYIFTIFQRY